MGEVIVEIRSEPVVVNVEVYRGLSMVFTDGTISGNGTPSNPLGSAPVTNTVLVGEVKNLTKTATGTTTIQDNLLIGKALVMVFTDNSIRIPTDYSLNATTGTVTFISSIDTGTILQFIYI